jgi:hypothetical protein
MLLLLLLLLLGCLTYLGRHWHAVAQCLGEEAAARHYGHRCRLRCRRSTSHHSHNDTSLTRSPFFPFAGGSATNDGGLGFM